LLYQVAEGAARLHPVDQRNGSGSGGDASRIERKRLQIRAQRSDRLSEESAR